MSSDVQRALDLDDNYRDDYRHDRRYEPSSYSDYSEAQGSDTAPYAAEPGTSGGAADTAREAPAETHPWSLQEPYEPYGPDGGTEAADSEGGDSTGARVPAAAPVMTAEPPGPSNKREEL